jgi:hypothetical protein
VVVIEKLQLLKEELMHVLYTTEGMKAIYQGIADVVEGHLVSDLDSTFLFFSYKTSIERDNIRRVIKPSAIPLNASI